VLDEETKQPVEGMWVGAALQIESKTIQGSVHSYLFFENPADQKNHLTAFTYLCSIAG